MFNVLKFTHFLSYGRKLREIVGFAGAGKTVSPTAWKDVRFPCPSHVFGHRETQFS